MPKPPVDPVVDSELDGLALDAVDAAGELPVAPEPHAEDAVEPPPSNAALEVTFGHGICSGLNPAD